MGSNQGDARRRSQRRASNVRGADSRLCPPCGAAARSATNARAVGRKASSERKRPQATPNSAPAGGADCGEAAGEAESGPGKGGCRSKGARVPVEQQGPAKSTGCKAKSNQENGGPPPARGPVAELGRPGRGEGKDAARAPSPSPQAHLRSGPRCPPKEAAKGDGDAARRGRRRYRELPSQPLARARTSHRGGASGAGRSGTDRGGQGKPGRHRAATREGKLEGRPTRGRSTGRSGASRPAPGKIASTLHGGRHAVFRAGGREANGLAASGAQRERRQNARPIGVTGRAKATALAPAVGRRAGDGQVARNAWGAARASVSARRGASRSVGWETEVCEAGRRGRRETPAPQCSSTSRVRSRHRRARPEDGRARPHRSEEQKCARRAGCTEAQRTSGLARSHWEKRREAP